MGGCCDREAALQFWDGTHRSSLGPHVCGQSGSVCGAARPAVHMVEGCWSGGQGHIPDLWSPAVFQERKLCAHPRIEIYKEDRIYFVCPLARQGDFYVPEMKELERKSRAAAAEAEDSHTDITGICGLRTGSIFDWHQPSQRWGSWCPWFCPLSRRRGIDLCPPGAQPLSLSPPLPFTLS